MIVFLVVYTASNKTINFLSDLKYALLLYAMFERTYHTYKCVLLLLKSLVCVSVLDAN